MPPPAVKKGVTQLNQKTSTIDVQPKRATAFYQAATVNERIRRWQMQDVEDNASEFSARSETCPTPQRHGSPALGEKTPKSQRQRSTKWVQKEDKGWIKQRKSVGVNPDEPTSEAEESFRPQYSRTESQRTRNMTSSRAEREERRKRRREHRARENNGDALVNDGIRVYMKSNPNLVDDDGLSHRQSSGSDGHPQYASQFSFNHDGSLPSDRDDRQTYQAQPTKYAQTLGRQQQQDLAQPKTRKRALLNKTKDLLAGKIDAETPSNRMPGIEAWLDDQPVDIEVPDNRSDIQSQPSKQRRRKSQKPKIAVQPTIQETLDPNNIWESVAPKDEIPVRKSRRKSNRQTLSTETSRRLFSFEVCEDPGKGDVEDPPHTSGNQDDARSVLMNKTSHRQKSIRNRSEVPAPPLVRADSIQPDRDISPHKTLTLNRAVQDDANEENFPPSNSQGLKRKLTTHEDLLSVLSQNRTRKSKKSVRLAQSTQAPPLEAVIKETFETIRQEEVKYMRELRTLVDGVTPVLLQSLLSKTDAVTTTDLFLDGVIGNANFARAVIDMGIALQRLKKSHDRMRLNEENIDSFLNWATTAQKAYADYVKAWRLGFQDVVVNLAPLEAEISEDMLARDVDGDVVNESGEKADVAYLQKRPLVRIKRITKHITMIRDVYPNSEKAIKLANAYSDLTDAAKQRHSEEQGRIEDEAAAAIDSTRARDIRNMAPFPNVQIEKNRNVRARDIFTLSMLHSNGQRLDCGIEIILRDSSQPGTVGDILICQVEDEGKWLLFQPVLLSHVSARRDQDDGDLVIMLRGTAGIGQTWHELLSLRAEDAGAAAEWLHMLGSNPLPSRLNHVPSWKIGSSIEQAAKSLPELASKPTLNADALAALSSDVDIPIGEPSIISKRPQVTSKFAQKGPEKVTKLSMGGGLLQKNLPEHYQHVVAIPQTAKPLPPAHTVSPRRPQSMPTPIQQRTAGSVDNIDQKSALQKTGYPPQSFSTSIISKPSSGIEAENAPISKTRDLAAYHTQTIKEPRVNSDIPMMSGALTCAASTPPPTYPTKPRNRVPSVNGSPAASETGSHSRVKSFSSIPLTNAIREQWSAFSGFRKKSESKVLPINEQVAALQIRSTTTQYTSRPSSPQPGSSVNHESRSASAEQNVNNAYDTSASGSSSEYETDTDATSEMSDDFGSEVKDQATPLVALGAGNHRLSGRPLPSLPPINPPEPTPISYKPAPTHVPERKKQAIAIVCSWSDRGMWEPIREDECTIVVSPGLIQAFPMSVNHSPYVLEDQDDFQTEDQQPLVEFELTPIVPLRKGTALDITIRSPPTANARIRTTNNVMFRSRTVQECDRLYNFINWSRCNNPRYAALARERAQSVSFAQVVPEMRSRSWFSFGAREKKSYRAGSRPPSIAESNASIGSLASAFTALKKFGQNSPFSINRSSVVHRPGLARGGVSLYSSSNGDSGTGSSTPAPASQAGFIPPQGPNVPSTSAEAANGGGMVNNMKVKLFVRQGQKWEALGQSLLTVLPAVPDVTEDTLQRVSQTPGTGPRQHFRLPSSSNTPHRFHGDGREKRVLITGASKQAVLLDETLHESCFEKVMQTGVALNVWKEDVDTKEFGGVMTGRSRTYMIQFRTSKEAGWVFNLCGSYRYGD